MTNILGYFAPQLHPDQQVNCKRYFDQAANVADSPQPAAAACCGTHTYTAGGITVGLSGRPLYRGRPVTAESSPDLLPALLERYRDSMPGLLNDLQGPFALAILDQAARTARLAVDRMGVGRISYTANDSLLAFGTSANLVSKFPGISTTLNHQALYDFLFMHMVPAPETVYENVFKLPPATMLEWTDGRIRTASYWMPTYQYVGRDEAPALQAELHDHLSRAVSDSGLDESTGAFLSGGLDSSSVAGTLSKLVDEPARTFTVFFGEAEFDELEFARAANEHFGCKSFEYQMSPSDIVDAFPRIASTYDEPFGNSSAAPTYFCAKLAADNGVTHLLAGDGGDELFGGNERYIRQGVFELYCKLPSWVRRRIVEPITRTISTDSRLTPFRKIRSYVDQALVPLPERFESWNFMHREGGEHIIDGEFLGSVNTAGPLRLMKEVWDSAPSDDLLEKMLFYDWRFTLADNDLRKVSTMCELAGVRVSYPLLHPAIVDLSTRVPPGMKIRGMELRTFFKNAMTGFLPAKILNKGKHGFGLPFGTWLKTDTDLSDMIYSYLADLKKRHIVSRSFVNDLIDSHREGHPSYYGYAIWDLAMLEAWLAAHATRTNPTRQA